MTIAALLYVRGQRPTADVDDVLLSSVLVKTTLKCLEIRATSDEEIFDSLLHCIVQ